MKVNEVIFEHHIEATESGTLIVSDLLCPLRGKEIKAEQILNNVVCCVIKNQRQNWQCPYWKGAVFPMESVYPIDCANEKHVKYRSIK